MKPDWILIANATRARLLQQEGEARLSILESFIHPAGRGKAGEAGDKGFARELARYLEQEARLDHFHALCLFVSAPLLAELQAELGKITQGMLCGTREQDLTDLTLPQLERCIAREFDAQAE